jgi:hypothetical protein
MERLLITCKSMTDKLQAYDLGIVTFTHLRCQTLQFYLVTDFVTFGLLIASAVTVL